MTDASPLPPPPSPTGSDDLAGNTATASGFSLLPPPPPEHFLTLRSEDGRVAVTDHGLEIQDKLFGWRELEAVDVRHVRWLLGVMLGGFVLCGFLLGYLQFWLRSTPAAAGIGLGALLLVWGVRGTNRWRLHRPGQEPSHFAFSGPTLAWQQLAQEANHRIRQRHREAALEAAYWLQVAEASATKDNSNEQLP